MVSLIIAAAPSSGDPVGGFLQTWAGYAQGWMKYILILAVVFGFLLFTVGHHRGWGFMREALAGAVFVMIVIALIPTLFP